MVGGNSYGVPQAFFWGSNGEKLTAQQVRRQREFASALFGKSDGVAQNGWEGLSQLASSFTGTVLQSRADEAEAAARSEIAQLMQGVGADTDMSTLLSIYGNEFATDADRAVAQLLLSDQLEKSDPLYQLQVQTAQAQLDALRSPQAPSPIEVGGVLLDPNTYEPIFDSRAPTTEDTPDPIEVGGVLVDPVTFQPLFDSRDPPTGDSAREQQIARLVETGMDRTTAINITDGRWIRETNPITGEFVIYDMATGQPVQGPHTVGAPQSTAGRTPQASAANMSVADPAVVQQFGQQYPASNDAFGMAGAAQGAINTVGDAIGVGAPYPDVQQTQADFGLLRESLLNDIAAGYGRQPPSWLLQEIRNLTPSAGNPFEGAGGAVSKLNAIGRHLQNELALTQEALERDLSPASRQELEARLQSLQAGLSRVTGAINSFGPQASQGQDAGNPPEGVPADVWGVMTPEERALWQ